MTARIYEFPARGRYAAAAQEEEETKFATDASLTRAVKIVSGGAWYHEEAVAAERTSRQ